MGWCYRTVIIFGFLMCLGNKQVFGYATPVGFEGEVVRWPIGIDNPQVSYSVDSSGVYGDASLIELVIDEAASMWTNAEGSYIELVPFVNSNSSFSQITIYLQDSIDGGQFASAYTVYDETDENGLVRCSIYASMNGSFYSISKSVLHEFGHCLGLGHSLIPEAIMSYHLDKNDYALDIDDEAALSRLYPADGSIPELPPGCAIADRVGNASSFWLLVILLAPIFVKLKATVP